MDGFRIILENCEDSEFLSEIKKLTTEIVERSIEELEHETHMISKPKFQEISEKKRKRENFMPSNQISQKKRRKM